MKALLSLQVNQKPELFTIYVMNFHKLDILFGKDRATARNVDGLKETRHSGQKKKQA